jgi:GGDEF domain-containing protein
MLALAASTVVLFGIVGEQLLRIQSQRALSQQACICAAALTPGSDGDLSDSVAALQTRSDRGIAVSMSARVASLPGDACESGHALVNRADVALYAAKRNGKNRVSTSPSSYQSSPTPIPVPASG